MINGLLDRETLVRTELEKAFEQVKGWLRCHGESLSPFDGFSSWRLTDDLKAPLDEHYGLLAIDKSEFVVTWHEERQHQL